MELCLCKTLWGVEDAGDPSSWESIFSKISKEGYKAVEVVPAFSFRGHEEAFRKILTKYDLSCVVQVHTMGGYFRNDEYIYLANTKLDDHINSLHDAVEEVVAAVGPHLLFINCHSGHDSWGIENAVTYLQEASRIGEKFDVRILHETHRQRLFFNPYVTRDILRHPSISGQIELTADLSHWVCVCENIFDEDTPRDEDWWPETLELVASHTALIHCRVGYTEGPQVADPLDPESKEATEAHLKWWAAIWENQAKRGFCQSWNEPEHGPPPYLQVLPYTQQPVADLWNINTSVRNLLKDRFEKKFLNQNES